MAVAPARVIVDTGPLIGWFDAADSHHAAVRGFFDGFEGELISTWPVLTEVCHLLPERMVSAFLRWVGSGGLTVVDVPAAATIAMADRMDKYADLPMDLADASLVWVAEALGVLDIVTVDRRDFGIYRTERGRTLRNMLDAPSGAVRKRRRRRDEP
jgi:predicted nucleic acid-binding protein